MKQAGNVIDEIFGTFPREIGKHRRVVNTRSEFYELVNKYNGYCNLYSSIYSITNYKDYDNVIVDKIYSDFDNRNRNESGDIKCWAATKRFHNYLLKENLKHIAFLSGNGFNIYIGVKPSILNNPKEALRSAMKELASKAELTIGNPEECDIDNHVVGDVARISRIPNTWNMSANRFCIPLIASDFEKDYEDICMLATNQRFEFEVFGNKLINLLRFDSCKPPAEIEEVGVTSHKDGDIMVYMQLLPPFIRELFLTGKCRHKDRYLEIIACREVGIPKNVVDKFGQKYWTPEKYEHAKRECGGCGQINYLYKRTSLMVPKWETLEKEGFNISKEDRRFKFYKDRY